MITIPAVEGRRLLAKQAKPSKYRAKPVTIDGFRFASGKEAARYGHLVMLQRAKQISGLEVHPRFELHVNNMHVGFYTADFAYVGSDGRGVVEDVKSPFTRKLQGWSRTKKLMKACLNIDVVEVQ